jgi:hypothetical protein
VDAAQAAQPTPTRPQPAPVGELDSVRIAHHHVGDLAPAVHQHAHLPADIAADLAQIAGELVGQDPIGREAPPEEPFELTNLAGFEASCISKDPDGRILAARSPGAVAGSGGRRVRAQRGA